jgi:predicted permease
MDRELLDEMAFHLEMETRELIGKGLSPTEARRQAAMALGSVERHREKAREARGTGFLEDLAQDIRYGIHALRRTPGFTGTVLFILALGIGASAAIFSVTDGVLFQSLPYPEADRIVAVFSEEPNEPRDNFAGADFLDLKAGSRAFESFAGYQVLDFNLIRDAGAQRFRGASVTPEFFRVFGVDPALGRTFSAATDGPGRAAGVVLSYGFWQSVLGADTGVLGRILELNDLSYEVVGVMPPGFEYPERISLWASAHYRVPDPPFQDEEDPGLDRGAEYIRVVGRLREGVSLEEAQSEVDVVWGRVVQDYPDEHVNEIVLLLPLRDALTETVRPTLQILLGAVGLLLLILSGNVANLLLSRGSGRERELALRRALGATRTRIVSQLLTESLLLAGTGGLLGALFATWATSALLSLAPEGIPRLGEVQPDFRFVAFAVLVSVLIGLLAGLLPSLRLSRQDEGGGTLLSGSRGSGSRGRSRIRRGLVITEVAFSLVLLVGGGLMVRTLLALNGVDPGFSPERLFAAHISLPEPRYSGEAEIAGFVRSVEEEIRARPGVEAAGMVLSLPIRSGISGTFYFSVEGQVPEDGEEPIAGYQLATPGYFQTLGVPLLRGRWVSGADGADDPKVVLVNEELALRFFPDQEVLGQRLTWGDPEADDVEWSTVVGVVGNALQGGLDRDPRPEIFRLYAQAPLPSMTLVARGRAGAGSLASLLRDAVTEVDPTVPVYGVASMDELLSGSLARRRFATVLLAAFGVVALVLAAAGLYGILRQSVSLRAREMGIRVALGAPARGILRQVLGEGLSLTLAGLGIGVLLALPASHLMAGLVFQVPTTDPVTFMASGVVLVAVTLLACGPPARQAARSDPLEVLKEE